MHGHLQTTFCNVAREYLNNRIVTKVPSNNSQRSESTHTALEESGTDDVAVPSFHTDYILS